MARAEVKPRRRSEVRRHKERRKVRVANSRRRNIRRRWEAWWQGNHRRLTGCGEAADRLFGGIGGGWSCCIGSRYFGWRLAVTWRNRALRRRMLSGANVKGKESAAAEFACVGEGGARCVVSVAPAKLAALQGIGATIRRRCQRNRPVTRTLGCAIEYKGRAIIDSPVENLRDVWVNSLERTLQSMTRLQSK